MTSPHFELGKVNIQLQISATLYVIFVLFMPITPFSEDRLDACVFKCHECWQFETTSRALFSRHLRSLHNLSEAQFWVIFSRFVLLWLISYLSGAKAYVQSRSAHCFEDIQNNRSLLKFAFPSRISFSRGPTEPSFSSRANCNVSDAGIMFFTPRMSLMRIRR